MGSQDRLFGPMILLSPAWFLERGRAAYEPLGMHHTQGCPPLSEAGIGKSVVTAL